MKKSALLLSSLLFVATCSVFAQKNSDLLKGKIGITYSSFGTNDVIRFHPVMDDTSYEGDNFYTFGINYLYQLNHTFAFETGIEYSKHQILISVIMPLPSYASPYRPTFSLINIPVTLRVNFLKYCFINGGMFFDVEAGTSSPIDSQTGIGALFGVGIKYDFDNGLSVFANPYQKMHSLVSFSTSKYHQNVMESGFRFGLMMKLN